MRKPVGRPPTGPYRLWRTYFEKLERVYGSERQWLADWAQIQARISNKYKVDRVVGYAETPGPNPPVGEADLNVLGSATSNPLPPQVSLTVTERTNLRRNWGRIYIPGIASVHLTDVGRFSDANCIVFADWAQDMFAPYTVAPLHVNVVYSRADQSEHDILKVQVDDLFDVQRRRRYRAPAIREERTV